MIEINLIPDVKKELIRAKRTRNVVVTFSIAIGAAAVGVVVLLGVIIGGQSITSLAQNDAIKKESSKLLAVEDITEVLTIQNQLATIPSIEVNKPIASRVLGVLGIINASGKEAVEVSSLSLDVETGTMQIEGQTKEGYPGVEAIIKTLNKSLITYDERIEEQAAAEDDAIKNTENENSETVEPIRLLSEDAVSGEITYGVDEENNGIARFSLTLMLTPEFLDVKNQNMRVGVKEGGNVTDSHLGIPKSIFAERAKDKNTQEGGN